MHPPTSVKLTVSAEKSLSISVKTFFFFCFLFLETTWFWAKKTFEFPISAKKSLSISVKTFFLFYFFFVFGDHLILGGKYVRISDFGPKITLNFGEDIRIFEGLCLKSPPTKIF